MLRTTRQAAEVAGIPYLMLWRWTEAGHIKRTAAVTHGRKPVDPATPGSGSMALYDDAEVEVIKRMALLIRIGLTHPCAVKLARSWAEHPTWPIYLGEGVSLRVDDWHPEHPQQPDYVAAYRAAHATEGH